MADIAMCEGNYCPIKKQCYRYTAKANPLYQSYFSIVPYNFDTNKCTHFWDNEGRQNENT